MGTFAWKNPWNKKRFVWFLHVVQGHGSYYFKVNSITAINWLNKETGLNEIIPRLTKFYSDFV